jgi:hypothetical protein
MRNDMRRWIGFIVGSLLDCLHIADRDDAHVTDMKRGGRWGSVIALALRVAIVVGRFATVVWRQLYRKG